MGLSGKAAEPPKLEAPSIGELTNQSVNANIANLPAIIEAYKKYGPEAASQMLAAAQTLNPTLKPLGDLLNQRIGEVSAGGIPQTLKNAYEVNFRNSMASRGFADSPVSANAEAIGLAGVGETYAQNTFSAASDYASSLPNAPGLGDLGLDLPSVNEGVDSAANANDYANQVAMENYANEQAARKKKSQQAGAVIGGVVGAGVGLAGGPFGAIQGYQAGQAIGGTFF